jgi:hypothetical protein
VRCQFQQRDSEALGAMPHTFLRVIEAVSLVTSLLRS